MLVNKLNWISSQKAPPGLLGELNDKMSEFYGSFSKRRDYQNLNDELHDVDDHPNNKLGDQLAAFIVSQGFRNVAEVGCGSGKIYKYLLNRGFNGSYTGMEMAEYVISANRERYPDANWEVGSVYDLEQRPATHDCVFAFYVLEHLIYPDRGLSAMLNVVRPGGALMVIFPDFACTGIVPSQRIGLHYGLGAMDKLKKGKVLDALVAWWEARMMRARLKKINEFYGNFVINYTPYCLEKDYKIMLPDFDAVYIGNKQEVEAWSVKRGHSVTYPLGTEGWMAKNAFMMIRK